MTNYTTQTATNSAVNLLMQLISTPSVSRNENEAANIIEKFLENEGYIINRVKNNIWVHCKNYNPNNKTIMLNSHIDTVKPAQGWQTDPFLPILNNGKLTGLGSNDAGGPLVSILMSFIMSENFNLKYNRVFAMSAEEEVSGENGMQLLLKNITNIDAGIVGEPTCMELAIAEKGLLVLDCQSTGKAGHAARTGGINAITLAINDIEWLHTYKFEKESPFLGPVKMTVTQINSGTQHNVIPDVCNFVVDVRTNEHYSNTDVYNVICKNLKAKVTARSFRMNSSGIDINHPIVKAAKQLGINCFGSPTTSDQALITTFPTVKIGPGDSNRSHTANEFILVSELENGIDIYNQLLKSIDL